MCKQLDKLYNKRIAVIGGTSGCVQEAVTIYSKHEQITDTISIGLGAAQLLLEAGAHVHVISSSEHRVQAAVKHLDSPYARGHVGNVRDEKQLTDLLLNLAPLDHLIFSGVDMVVRGPLADVNLAEAKHLSEVKLWGSILIGKILAKYEIVNPGGSFTLTSGRGALYPGKGTAIGGALNGGVYSLTQGLAAELAEKRIRVNAVVPGMVKTELWDRLMKSKEAQETMFMKKQDTLSVGFVATPADIAEAYLYAVRADYMNGATIQIGKHCYRVSLMLLLTFIRWR